MSATPIAADHSEEFEQLAGLAALRVLDADEQARFEQHAQRCERCRTILRLDRETLGNLSMAAPEMDPSPGFKERLFARAEAELRPAEPARQLQQREPIQFRPRAPLRLLEFRRSVWASAVAAVLVIGVVAGSFNVYMNQVVATYALSGSAAGEARVLVHRSGAIELEMRGVADPPTGQVYEAWIIPPGQQPVAAGVTTRGEAKLPLTDQARGSTVAITLERGPNGVSAPSTPVLLAGTVAL